MKKRMWVLVLFLCFCFVFYSCSSTIVDPKEGKKQEGWIELKSDDASSEKKPFFEKPRLEKSVDSADASVAVEKKATEKTVEKVIESVSNEVVVPQGVVVYVKSNQEGVLYKNTLGVNRPPFFRNNKDNSGSIVNIASLYKAFGIKQVRLHDSALDLCLIYKDATILNVTTGQTTTQCINQSTKGSGGRPHYKWTVNDASKVDQVDLYDFTQTDLLLASLKEAGAKLYLRLGDSFNGPNDTGDVDSWAKVANNVLKHVLGKFKAGTQTTTPDAIEIHNEPNGMFWIGSYADFYNLYKKTHTAVLNTLGSGSTIPVGGAGFTHEVAKNMGTAGKLETDFVSSVGISKLGFFSAHFYGSCDKTNYKEFLDWTALLRTKLKTAGAPNVPLHLTEWNAGLGDKCGNALFSTPKLISFVAGILSLLQDDSLGYQMAHFYSGAPIMALFSSQLGATSVHVEPGAWAFWAHSHLSTGKLLETQVCENAVCGSPTDYAKNDLAVTSAKVGSKIMMVISNDSTASKSIQLLLPQLSSSTMKLKAWAPPRQRIEVFTETKNGALVPKSTETARVLGMVTESYNETLTASHGQFLKTLTLPAHSLLLVELN